MIGKARMHTRQISPDHTVISHDALDNRPCGFFFSVLLGCLLQDETQIANCFSRSAHFIRTVVVDCCKDFIRSKNGIAQQDHVGKARLQSG